MGYTTNFRGKFVLSKSLTAEQAAYLQRFGETRRMRRDATITETLPDPIRLAVGLPVGKEGGYFVGSPAPSGQDWGGDGVVDHNTPPEDQPGLWCQWVPDETGQAIEWDGGEKFYKYVEWLEYLIDNFLKPWGITLAGSVEYRGEDWDDTGTISVHGTTVVVTAR